jgi:hypothetical protein
MAVITTDTAYLYRDANGGEYRFTECLEGKYYLEADPCAWVRYVDNPLDPNLPELDEGAYDKEFANEAEMQEFVAANNLIYYGVDV